MKRLKNSLTLISIHLDSTKISNMERDRKIQSVSLTLVTG